MSSSFDQEHAGFRPSDHRPDGGQTPAGEYRYVATLMADIVGSTEITERIGAEHWFHLMQEVMDLAWAAIKEFHGHPVNFTGDGIFALFGAPVAVERASLNACRAALAIQERLHRHATRLQAQFGVLPGIRIGIAGGEVLVVDMALGDEVRPTATGSAVNLAARLQSLAETDGIVCSDRIVLDVGETARFEPIGAFEVKGFAEPQAVHRLVELAAGSGLAPRAQEAGFVGREGQMKQTLEWIADPGARPLCLVQGSAGIGKSRLVKEICRAVGETRQVHAANCSSETVTRPLFAVIEILRAWAGWKPDASRSMLETKLCAVTGAEAGTIGPLVEIVGGFAVSDGISTTDAALVARRLMATALRRIASRADCVTLIEDAHWIDPLSFDVLREVLHTPVPGMKILATSRSDALLRAGKPEGVLLLTLAPLTRSDIGKIAASLGGNGALPVRTLDLVCGKSEGNPFFATEILRHITVAGPEALDVQRIGSIENLLFARFDSLAPQTKEFLRAASVIGRSFDPGTAAAASGQRQARPLAAMAAAIIERDPSDPAEGLRFTHVLFRDTIYASIPPSRRMALHLAVGAAIEASDPIPSPDLAITLADHFERGGVALRALEFLELAAIDALRLYALDTCDSQLGRAFRLIETAGTDVPPDLFGRLLENWVRCHDAIGNYRKVTEIFAAYLPRLRADGEPRTLHTCLSLNAKAQCHLCNYAESLALIEEAISVAAAMGDRFGVAVAKVVKIRVLADSGMGSLEDVRELFESTGEISDSHSDLQLILMRHYHMIAAVRSFGRYAESWQLCEQLETLGTTLGVNYMVGGANWLKTVLNILRDDPVAALGTAETCVRFSVPGTNFRRCGLSAIDRARLSAGTDVPTETFLDYARQADDFGDITLGTANLVSAALSAIFRAELRRGFRIIDEIFRRPGGGGAIEIQRSLRILHAELLMSLAGILRSGRSRPRLRAADLILALRLRLGARRRAEQLMTELAQSVESHGGCYLARATGNLALIARAKGETDRARQLLDRSIALYRAEGQDSRIAQLQAHFAN